MATVAAINQLGESVVALLRTRRDLLASAGQLAPVPTNIEISQISLSKLVAGTAPTIGLSLICYNISHSDHKASAPHIPGLAVRPEIAVELSYLLASWSPKPEDEQASIAWAMLELAGFSTLDQSVLRGGTDVWDAGEAVQIVPDNLGSDDLHRLWDAVGHKQRLSTSFKARVIRLRQRGEQDHKPVVASRFGFEQAPATVLEES